MSVIIQAACIGVNEHPSTRLHSQQTPHDDGRPEIIRMFTAQHSHSHSQSQPAAPSVERRKQPLCNAVRVAMSLYLEQLNGHQPDGLYKLVIEEVERPLIEILMHRCDGNQTKVAQYLGLNRGTLRKKLKHHGLDSQQA